MNDDEIDDLHFTPFDAAPARLTINLGNLVENWRTLNLRSGNARASAVVKADAYGLGIEEVTAALYHHGCHDFFVANADEGMLARQFAPDARIFVLAGAWPGVEKQFFEYDLVPVLASLDQLGNWMSAVAEFGDHPCALAIDTGMNRLGLSVEEALELANDPTRPASFAPVHIMSHLACADEPGNPMNDAQLAAFQRVAEAFEGTDSSIANSAGIHLGPDFHFDMTRPGIALYGGSTGSAAAPATLPVVTAQARIVQLRKANAGETVSYGATHTLSRDSRLAIVAAGYADGWHRAMSGAGVPLRTTDPKGAEGFVCGQRVPLIGRITMDLSIFDVTDIPENELRVGDYVELFGENIPLEEVAKSAGTIGYELLTSLGNRYQRDYV